MCIYGHNQTLQRGRLWDTITSTPLPDAIWILCGDFNVVDRLEDRVGGLPSTGMRAAEMLSWNNMLLHFRVSDSFLLPEFRNVTRKLFSWDNGQMGNRRLASRIDRIYIPQEIQVLGGQCGIWPGYRKISDHSAYFIKIHDRDVIFPKRKHFNKGLLDKPESRQTLVDAWRSAIDEDPSRSWAAKLQHALITVKQTSDTCTAANSQHWKAMYDAEIQDILEAEELLHGDWENTTAREQLAAAQLRLHEIRQARLEKRINKMGARWTKLGDRCTKPFFEIHKERKPPVKIKELVRDQRVITDQKELKLYATQFYRALYTADSSVEQNQTARDTVLRSVKRVVTEEQNLLLTAPFSMEEVTHAVQQLPVDKAPSFDSIPIEFYQKQWSFIGLDIYAFVVETFETCFFPSDLNRGLITLIPKSDSIVFLTNFRPITLLTTLYKILAKLLALRMTKNISIWIDPSQTGFVPGKCIFDNLFLAFEALQWGPESNQDLVMLLLDFEKAYDRLSWSFLEQTMAKMGFSDQWIAWVRCLYSSSESSVMVNGHAGEAFQLQRSVRQGCPLAPYLFLIAANVLPLMLKDPEYGVTGLTLPDGSSTCSSQFADDTNLLLQGTVQNLDRTMVVLNLYCEASGSKLNWTKTRAI